MKGKLTVICLTLGIFLATTLTATAQTSQFAGYFTANASGPASVQNQPQTASLPYTTTIMATIGEPQTLDPALDYESIGQHVLQQLYETLVFYNREKSTELIPMLATKWTISPDGRTYTFTIRKDVLFHNGNSLTPEDVALYSSTRAAPGWDNFTPMACD